MGLRIWASLGNGGLSHKGYKIQYLQQLQSPPEDLCEQLEKVYIDLGDRYFQVGKSLQIMEKVELLLFIVNNMDVFAWSPYEALGVDLEFIFHRLNVDPNHPPWKQKPHRSLDIHADAIKEKVNK